MDNPRPEKVAVVNEVRHRLNSAQATILTEYRGLDVTQMATLRRSLRAAGGDFKIYKNTLARLAVRAEGRDDLVELLQGPTAIAFVDGDAVGVAKALVDFAKEHEALLIKGGLLGDALLTVDQTKALAKVPPRDELLARFAGALEAPLTKTARSLAALPQKLAYGLAALIEQAGGVPEADESEAPAAESEAPAPAPETDAAESEAPATETEAPAEAPAPEAEATDTDTTDDESTDTPEENS